jgi:hypothetical protein
MDEIRLFYSYSSADEEYRKRLETSLVMLKRFEGLMGWHFRKIIAGEEWDKEIKGELEKADIILLLISPDFLVSDYCFDIEVKRAIEKHEEGSASVVPVILRQCDWKHEKSPIKILQGVPENGIPISLWPDQDVAYQDITEKLKLLIKKKRN